MSPKALEVGGQVHVMENGFGGGPASINETIGIVRSVDTNRRRTEPHSIYSVELPGEDAPIEFEYREKEFVSGSLHEIRSLSVCAYHLQFVAS